MSLQLPEVEAKYFLPVIRQQLAQELSRQGLSQQKIAARLQITQAAVSHYINKERAAAELPEEFKQEIRDMAHQLQSIGEAEFAQWLSDLCQRALHNGLLCNLHRQHENIPEDCDKCFQWSS